MATRNRNHRLDSKVVVQVSHTSNVVSKVTQARVELSRAFVGSPIAWKVASRARRYVASALGSRSGTFWRAAKAIMAVAEKASGSG